MHSEMCSFHFKSELIVTPRIFTVFDADSSLLDLSPKSTVCELFKAKSADPRTYSPPSFTDLNLFKYAFSAI